MKVAVGTGTVTVRALHGASLDVPNHRSPPGLVLLPVEVRNTGNSPEPLAVTADLPAGWRLADDAPRFSVPPYSTATQTLRIATPDGTAVAEYPVTVRVALPDGRSVDAKGIVTVQPWRHVRFTAVSEEPVGRDALAFDVRAENAGNVRAPFSVLTPDLPDGWAAVVEPAGATLAPGESTVFRVVVTPPKDVDLGEWTLPVYAHFQGVQPGSTEGRANRGALEVSIVQPDLVVEDFAYSPRLDVQPLDRVLVRASVANAGNEDATNVQVVLFVDDVLIEAVEVAHLGPGERAEVTFNWTAVGGKHAMTVVADPFGDLLEIASDNNAATRLIEVEGEQQTVRGVPAQTVETPAVGPLGLLAAALVVALALTRKRRSKT